MFGGQIAKTKILSVQDLGGVVVCRQGFKSSVEDDSIGCAAGDRGEDGEGGLQALDMTGPPIHGIHKNPASRLEFANAVVAGAQLV